MRVYFEGWALNERTLFGWAILRMAHPALPDRTVSKLHPSLRKDHTAPSPWDYPQASPRESLLFVFTRLLLAGRQIESDFWFSR